MSTSLDLIDTLANLTAGGAVATLCRQRETARAATQACFETLFGSAHPVPDLSPLERELAAQRTAALFAWANRLMQTLGQPVGPGAALKR